MLTSALHRSLINEVPPRFQKVYSSSSSIGALKKSLRSLFGRAPPRDNIILVILYHKFVSPGSVL
ncbi:hypothetical protein ABDI16_13390, partial [Cytobacillus firmus]